MRFKTLGLLVALGTVASAFFVRPSPAASFDLTVEVMNCPSTLAQSDIDVEVTSPNVFVETTDADGVTTLEAVIEEASPGPDVDLVLRVKGGDTGNWYVFDLVVEWTGSEYTIASITLNGTSPNICSYGASQDVAQLDMADH